MDKWQGVIDVLNLKRVKLVYAGPLVREMIKSEFRQKSRSVTNSSLGRRMSLSRVRNQISKETFPGKFEFISKNQQIVERLSEDNLSPLARSA